MMSCSPVISDKTVVQGALTRLVSVMFWVGRGVGMVLFTLILKSFLLAFPRSHNVQSLSNTPFMPLRPLLRAVAKAER
jgi:hypothetical protein